MDFLHHESAGAPPPQLWPSSVEVAACSCPVSSGITPPILYRLEEGYNTTVLAYNQATRWYATASAHSDCLLLLCCGRDTNRVTYSNRKFFRNQRINWTRH